MRPTTPFGSPGARVSSVQCSPPSVLLNSPRARTAARHLPRDAVRLPERGVQDVRVLRVHRQVDRAALVVAVQHLPPRLPAVRRLEHAALGVAPRRVPEGRDVGDVGVLRIDADLRDRLRLGEAEVRPRLAAVGGAVDAVALHDVAADAGLAHPDVDHVGVRLRHRHRADGARRELSVGDGLPRLAAVGRLPEPPADRAEVVLERPRGAARDGDGAAAAVRADGAPLHAAELHAVDGGGRRGTLRVRRAGDDGERGDERRRAEERGDESGEAHARDAG